ncbi:sugar phosphate isomerase/epimerase family protein [Lacipirellula parvula]|uniref:Xylose isomerase-like TIM barrel domain-containing protein n=1 Tax=Lacipirellula parvula TaxID=2650471 RepID=A0A5K7XH98_9BACT|nr:sugar phosphate isomerase/epimerase family protein [Lacipirellula parvula]BBO34321.1 hypothetical protein PLANPX_3933 [Lacipirellula parvula]
MSDWPIGISTGAFYQRPILKCLEDIRDAGFTIVEICSYPAHLNYRDLAEVTQAAQRLRELQLEPYSFHAPFADQIDITSLDESTRAASVGAVETAAIAAAELGARNFVIHPGPERSPVRGEERLLRMERGAESLNYLAERCRQLGTALVMENMLPHLCFGLTKDMLWMLGAIDRVDVGLCLDTGHAFLSGDITKVVHKLSGHLWMVHANDNYGERDDHFPPGQGRIDWKALVGQLAHVHFDGAIILEIGLTSAGTFDFGAAQQSRKYLHELAGEHELAERFK